MKKIYTDGGSRGNPGKAACAFLVVEDEKITQAFVRFLGDNLTNNEAEYSAIIFALETIKSREVEIISDSELVIRQITGKYKINKPQLQLLYQKVIGLISGRIIKFSNAPRQDPFIWKADKVLNKELNKHKKIS